MTQPQTGSTHSFKRERERERQQELSTKEQMMSRTSHSPWSINCCALGCFLGLTRDFSCQRHPIVSTQNLLTLLIP